MAEEGSLHLSAGSAASASAGGSSACAIASCRARWTARTLTAGGGSRGFAIIDLRCGDEASASG
jgi:hypothetical protein